MSRLAARHDLVTTAHSRTSAMGTTDPSSIVIHDGPAIPNIIADGGTDMMTAGDWAATVGSDGMLDRIYVWRISTGEGSCRTERASSSGES